MTVPDRLIESVSQSDRVPYDATKRSGEFDTIIDSMVEAVFVLDAEGRIVRTNRAFADIIAEDPVGWPYSRLHEDFGLRVVAAPDSTPPALRSLAGEVVVHEHIALEAPARGEVSISVSSSPLRDEQGRITGAVAVWADVTEELRRIRLSEALNDLSLATRECAVTETTLTELVERASSALRCDCAATALLDGEEWCCYHTHRLPGIDGVRVARSAAPFLCEAEKTLDVVSVEDATTDRRVDGFSELGGQMRAFMVVPLSILDDVVALIFLGFTEGPRRFSSAELDFGRKLGTTLSLAMQNARLYESLQRELTRTRALREVAAAASGCLAVTEVCNRVADVASDMLGASVARVFVVDGGSVKLVAGRGTPKHVTLSRLPLSDASTVGKVALKGRVYTHEDESPTEETRGEDTQDPHRDSRWVAMPIPGRHTASGVLAFVFEGRRPFTRDEMSLYQAVAEQLSVALERARLFEAEHRVADTLQHALLSLPARIAGLDIAHLYEGASEEALVGGDFYDVFELSSESIALLVGDVSGKGLEAASLTALVKNGIRAHALEGHKPAAVLGKTNDMVVRFTAVEVYVTVFFGVLNKRTGELRYSMAGHPPPLVLRPDGIAWALPGRNPIMGAFPGIEFTDFREDLRPGDSVLLYTDGVVETRRGRELFGEERLIRFAQKLSGLAPEETAQRVFEEVRQHAGGHLQDDMAVMVARLHPRKGRDLHPFQQRLHFAELE